MTAAAAALVLAAALCHAGWNFLVKRINGGPELLWLFSAISSLLYLPLALWIVIVARPPLGPAQILFMAGSTVLHLGYFALLQAGYRRGDLSLVYPVARATGPILSTLFAVAVLGERLSARMALGGGVIVLGILMLTGPRGGAGRAAASVPFGLAIGVLIGCYTVWDAHAVAALMVPPLLIDYVSGLGRVVVLAPLALRRRDRVIGLWRAHRAAVIGVAVLAPLAYILVLEALTFTPVAYVAPLREVSVILSVLAGSLLLGEGQLRRRLGWSFVVLAGMALLMTG